MAVSEEDFRNALSRFASGVCVVTTIGPNGELYGITVSAFCSVSLSPPLILICVEKTTNTHRGLLESDYFVVNFLSEEQVDLSERFAMPSPPDLDSVDYTQNSRGIPVLGGTLASLECKTIESHDGGDHTVFMAEVEASRIGFGMPLLYFKGSYGGMK